MALLPEHSLFDSVRCSMPITRRGLFYRWGCEHKFTTSYTRTDHRPGPGWMSDSYEGRVCVDCGTVVEEEQTY